MTSAEPGPWRTSRTPYLREILDSFTTEGVEQITLMTSTQVGKTETLLNLLGYTIDQDPGATIFVMPRGPDAERILDLRIRPMVEASPSLRAQLTGKPRDWKTASVKFRRSLLFMAGAQSPADLAGNPCRYAFFDEADKAPQWAGREADPLDLVRERLRTFPLTRRLVASSTPTTREGRIAKEFELSDRRRYYIPCPHCGHWQTLRWERVEFNGCKDAAEMLNRRLATYPCESCETPITDGEKLEALDRGRWVSDFGSIDQKTGEVTEPKTPNPNRGFHLWAGYSPWLTWAEIAAKFLEAHASNDPAKLMNFVNSWLAELWEEKVEEPTDDALSGAIVVGYAGVTPEGGRLPEEVKVLTAGVDTQKRELFVSVWGWGYDERAWLIYARKVGSFAALEERIVRGQFDGMRIRMIAIDARHRRDEVFAMAREHRTNVRAIRGVELDSPIPFSVKKVDRDPDTGATYRRGMVVYHVNVGIFKDRLSLAIDTGPHPERPRAFHLYEDPAADFMRQMSSERKVIERKGQKARERWVLKPGRRANHYWDTAVYAWAAAEMIHVPLLKSEGKASGKRRGRRRRLGSNL